MKTVFRIIALTGLTLSMSSCFNSKKPNYQYMPNMYESTAYETYSESDAFKRGGVEAQTPVPGTIKRGYVPYEYPNTTAGLEAARAGLQSPLDTASIDLDRGGQLFGIYCAICHGEKGDGKGKLVKQEKFLGVPSYKDRAVTTGSVFHVETYGLNSMGSYANQLNQEERWQVAHYVMKLKGEL
ncbi:c-type cytochrome [Flavobacterium silvaticum]|uniref:Cytochrome c n=1 Tax=Flavobacterium silvaticum TaxID=1852020 RepID=A0A972JFC8_9FLAO|nr:cytochrome c [Flavobacterium silvaticum]NMH27086.1 cytochrome c [Flavobacterium silvaticum]